MNDKKLEELHQYFTGYGSPHDELIIRLIKEYRLSIEEIYQHIEDKEELFKQNKRYREALEEIVHQENLKETNVFGYDYEDISSYVEEVARKALEESK